MSAVALQPHYGRDALRPPRPVALLPQRPPVPPPPVAYGPAPIPLRPEHHIPLTPQTGMTREEIEKRIADGPEKEISDIKTKVRAALQIIGESKITDTVRMTRERQNRIIGILAQIAG